MAFAIREPSGLGFMPPAKQIAVAPYHRAYGTALENESLMRARRSDRAVRASHEEGRL
jgi:hypothetical protein